MVQRAYSGLGPVYVCIATFDALTPYVEQMRRLQALFPHMSADDFALEIAGDALETAAHHFTRRRLYFNQVKTARTHDQNYFLGFADRGEAIAAFEALQPYRRAKADIGAGPSHRLRSALAVTLPDVRAFDRGGARSATSCRIRWLCTASRRSQQ